MINSDYQAPLLFRNGHIHTIYPTLFRKVENVVYRRERIETHDNDFLDLDWSVIGSDSLAVISHGLEGDSQRAYVKGMVQAMNHEGIDALAWNFRGCSGEPNRRLRFTHNGSVDDLHAVVAHSSKTYQNIFLIGFSMGGNMSLLYLGEKVHSIPDSVKGSVTFSVPCDLRDASFALERRENFLYMKRFLILMHQKIKAIKTLFPQEIDDHNYHQIKSFRDFDGKYTAPLHGFASAEDYWWQCSSRHWLKQINVPSVIVNSVDDPFLADGCYPVNECAVNPNTTLEITRHGGHVGFVGREWNGRYWSEDRAVTFIKHLIEQHPTI